MFLLRYLIPIKDYGHCSGEILVANTNLKFPIFNNFTCFIGVDMYLPLQLIMRALSFMELKKFSKALFKLCI